MSAVKHFSKERIALNDKVCDLMLKYFGRYSNPVPKKILLYLKNESYLYKRLNDYSFVPEDEESLKLFGDLEIRAADEKTAIICQKWCSEHNCYFEVSYKDLPLYSRAKIRSSFVVKCESIEAIKTAISMIKQAPFLTIAVSTMELLQTLENELLSTDICKERLATEQKTYWPSNSEDQLARFQKRRALRQNIAYWAVNTDTRFYEELDLIYIPFRCVCRSALMYFASWDCKVAFNAACTEASAEDVEYLKSIGIGPFSLEGKPKIAIY